MRSLTCLSLLASLVACKFPELPPLDDDGARAHVDLANMTLQPVWSRGLTGTRALTVDSAAVDAVTGDLYLFGALFAGGTADLGAAPITALSSASAAYLIKIRRGS